MSWPSMTKVPLPVSPVPRLQITFDDVPSRPNHCTTLFARVMLTMPRSLEKAQVRSFHGPLPIPIDTFCCIGMAPQLSTAQVAATELQSRAHAPQCSSLLTRL